MNKKIIFSLLIALSLNSTAAFANPISNGIEGTQKMISNVNPQISRYEIEDKIQILDDQIQNTMIEIDNNNAKISENKKNISKIQNDLDKLQKEADENERLCDERMRVLYMDGSYSYIDVLFDAESFGDLFRKLEIVKTIIKIDRKSINDYQKKLDSIASQKKALETKKIELESIQSKNNEKLKSLENSKNEQKKILAKYKPTSQSQVEIDKILSGLLADRNVRSRGGQIPTYSLISYAARFLGTPYVWGGQSPKGFDCSGFTQYVYKHFGIELPRVAADQQKIGYAVPLSELRAGDLIFYGEPAHHVAMYIGNGYVIHAPQTGDVVKVTTVHSDATARRVK